MKHLQLVTALILCSLLIACEGGETVSATPNENLYGTWIETRTLGEVVFREDGTVNWKGTEGTYEFLSSSSSTTIFGDVYTYAPSWVSVELSGGWFSSRSFTISSDYTPSHSRPDGWTHEGRSFLRQGTFEYPSIPSHFERMPDKLASDSHSDDDFDPTTTVLHAGPMEMSSNQILNLGHWHYRFDKKKKHWVKLKYSRTYHVTPRLMYDSIDDVLSLDGGLTWKDAELHQTRQLKYTFLGIENWVERDSVSIGTDIFSYNHMDRCHPGKADSDIPCQRPEIWVLDATAEQPSPELRSSFDLSMWSEESLKTAPYLNNALIRHLSVRESSLGEEQELYFISYDRGLTWADWTPPPHPFDYNAGYVFCDGEYRYGSQCYRNAEPGLYWYDVDTSTWSTHTVDFENVLGVTPNRDGVYFKRGHEIHKWSLDGTETLITTFPAENYAIERRDLFEVSVVGNDLYVSNIFGLWRMDL